MTQIIRALYNHSIKAQKENEVDYKEFLERKKIRVTGSGFESDYVNEKLFGWQTDIVRWCLRKGKSAIFSDCGSGKTAMQLEWAAEEIGRAHV